MRWIVVAVLLFSSGANAFEHAGWDALLKRHVVLLEGGKASQLDYAGVAAEREALRAYLSSVSAVREAEFDAWPKPEQMAFLINAYNAYIRTFPQKITAAVTGAKPRAYYDAPAGSDVAPTVDFSKPAAPK